MLADISSGVAMMKGEGALCVRKVEGQDSSEASGALCSLPIGLLLHLLAQHSVNKCLSVHWTPFC